MYLTHKNFVASAVELSDVDLRNAIHWYAEVQKCCQSRNANLFLDDIIHEAFMWKDHILALMLLRDCLGREHHRRHRTLPPFPPMLARGWLVGDMYDVCKFVQIPEWLTLKNSLHQVSS